VYRLGELQGPLGPGEQPELGELNSMYISFRNKFSLNCIELQCMNSHLEVQ
jgi:hypothetical protein